MNSESETDEMAEARRMAEYVAERDAASERKSAFDMLSSFARDLVEDARVGSRGEAQARVMDRLRAIIGSSDMEAILIDRANTIAGLALSLSHTLTAAGLHKSAIEADDAYVKLHKCGVEVYRHWHPEVSSTDGGG